MVVGGFLLPAQEFSPDVVSSADKQPPGLEGPSTGRSLKASALYLPLNAPPIRMGIRSVYNILVPNGAQLRPTEGRPPRSGSKDRLVMGRWGPGSRGRYHHIPPHRPSTHSPPPQDDKLTGLGQVDIFSKLEDFFQKHIH